MIGLDAEEFTVKKGAGLILRQLRLIEMIYKKKWL